MIGSLQIKIDQLVDFATERGIRIAGSSSVDFFTGIETIDEATEDQITFCRFEGDRGEAWLRKTNAGAIFLQASMTEFALDHTNALLLCSDIPRMDLAILLRQFWVEPKASPPTGNNPEIHPTARIAEDVTIGSFSIVGRDVVIGSGTTIGSNTRIEYTEIGSNCRIGSNVVLGGPGFGYEDDPVTGEVIEFPHIGRLRLGDRVRLGSSNCVDRASIGYTVIEDDVKTDNLVHIGHNVRIGARTKITPMTIISGSVSIGEDCWIAPGVSIRDWRSVGNNVLVGIGSVVTKNLEDNITVVGNPARQIQRTSNRYR